MRKVRAGETIIKEGDLGDEMYIVDRSAQHSTAQHSTAQKSLLWTAIPVISFYNISLYLIPFYVLYSINYTVLVAVLMC